MKSNMQGYDEKMINIAEDLEAMIASTISSMMKQINISKFSLS